MQNFGNFENSYDFFLFQQLIFSLRVDFIKKIKTNQIKKKLSNFQYKFYKQQSTYLF